MLLHPAAGGAEYDRWNEQTCRRRWRTGHGSSDWVPAKAALHRCKESQEHSDQYQAQEQEQCHHGVSSMSPSTAVGVTRRRYKPRHTVC